VLADVDDLERRTKSRFDAQAFKEAGGRPPSSGRPAPSVVYVAGVGSTRDEATPTASGKRRKAGGVDEVTCEPGLPRHSVKLRCLTTKACTLYAVGVNDPAEVRTLEAEL
jgi:hypothetical protein